jgi:hypothetical protein
MSSPTSLTLASQGHSGEHLAFSSSFGGQRSISIEVWPLPWSGNALSLIKSKCVACDISLVGRNVRFWTKADKERLSVGDGLSANDPERTFDPMGLYFNNH